MSWQKFTDRARESRKVRRASPEAITLWWAVGNWCCEHRTDGFIAKDELPDAWRPIGRRFDHARAGKECADVGLFTDHGDRYEVHDFLEFNHSREESDERKAAAARRSGRYRARQKQEKDRVVTVPVMRDGTRDGVRDAVDASRVTNDVTHAKRHAGDVTGDPSDVRHAPPVPSRPDPSRPASDQTENARAQDEAASFDLSTWDLHSGWVARWKARRGEQKPDGGPYGPQSQHDTEVWREVVVRIGGASKANGAPRKVIAERLLDALFADQWADERGFPPKLLVSRFDHYSKGPVRSGPKKSDRLAPIETPTGFSTEPINAKAR